MKFIDENGTIITEAELLAYYNENMQEIYNNSGAETFGQYLGNCLSKNGALTVL